jgi:hypothetical protein
MSARSERRTAIHEAGHCALLFALFGVEGCRGATILPNYKAGTSGHAVNPGMGRAAQSLGEEDDYPAKLHTLAPEAFCLRRAIMYFAGAEAVRQLTRARNPDAGANDDTLNAASDLETLTTDGETFDLLEALARRRCVAAGRALSPRDRGDRQGATRKADSEWQGHPQDLHGLAHQAARHAADVLGPPPRSGRAGAFQREGDDFRRLLMRAARARHQHPRARLCRRRRLRQHGAPGEVRVCCTWRNNMRRPSAFAYCFTSLQCWLQIQRVVIVIDTA